MTALLTCLRCGEESPDVRMALVDLEEEARRDGTTVRTVEVEIVRPLRHVNEVTKVRAAERFGVEWRCADRAACEERYRRMMQPAATTQGEEAPSWMR